MNSPGKSKDKKDSNDGFTEGLLGSNNNSNTVYGELKLSERLSLEMVSLRKEKE